MSDSSNTNQRLQHKKKRTFGGRFSSFGSGDWIRTSDLVVNSHPLYR